MRILHYIALSVITFFCVPVSAQDISLPEEFLPQQFDVISYDANIRFENVIDKHVRGVVRMAVIWTAPSASPILFAHLKSCTIDSAVIRSAHVTPVLSFAPLSATDTMSYYRFALPHAVAANDTDTLVMYYSGTMTDEGGAQPWGGVHYKDQVLYALGVGFRAPHVSTTQHWMPCYDHPSDKALFRGRFNVPEAFDVASVGLRGRDTIVDGRRIIDWVGAEPFATYLLTFAAAPYHLLRSMEGIVPIEVYALARDTASARISFYHLPRMVRTFAERFVPYPFEKVGYCITEKGAMEHQTMVSYPVQLVQRRDTINDVAAHELAHQWFGDLVSPLDFRHAWLTESFATYSENLWREELHGKSASVNLMKGRVDNYITRIANVSASNAEGVFPLYDFPRTSPSSNYPETIYQKGAVVLGMLRHIMGDTAFFAGLRLYLQTHYNSTATTADMKTALETASGIDLTSFFDEWVFGKGWPKVEVDYRRVGLNWDVTIRQVQHLADPTIPLFTTLPVNVKYTDMNDVNVDTVLLANAAGEISYSCKKPLGINNGNLLRSLLEVVLTAGVDESGPVTRRVSIAPNPASDICTIERSTTSSAASITIVDSVGRTLLTKVIDAGVASTTVSLAELAAGSYTMQVVEAGQPISVPLIISR